MKRKSVYRPKKRNGKYFSASSFPRFVRRNKRRNKRNPKGLFGLGILGL